MSTVLEMPRSSVVAPRTIRVELAEGRWIELRERLNHGEYTAFYRSLYVPQDDELVRDPILWRDKVVVAYLVDWNLTDDDRRILPIRAHAPDEIQATLNGIEQDDFLGIAEAVEGHHNAIERAREEKKRARTIAGESSPI